MKTSAIITVLTLLFSSVTSTAQTVAEFVRMIDTEFEPYQEGEFRANDSLTDLKNGYYQRSFAVENEQGEEQKLLRQVAVFINNDSTKTIVETTSSYNFVCWNNEIKFYYYDGKLLRFENRDDYFLPKINVEELLPEKVLVVFKKYYQLTNKDLYPSFKSLIFNAYDNFRYELPRYGTEITVHLDFCDYFGTDLNVEISEEDWRIIKNGIVPIKLSYDKELRQFVK